MKIIHEIHTYSKNPDGTTNNIVSVFDVMLCTAFFTEWFHIEMILN